jgi:hypothetical protein
MAEIVDVAVPPHVGKPRPLVLWLPLLWPMVAALVALEAAYALTGPACRRDARWFLHLVVLAMLASTVFMALTAWRMFREHGRVWETESEGRETRTRFLAILGILSSVTAGLILIAQWMPIFFLHPCALS